MAICEVTDIVNDHCPGSWIIVIRQLSQWNIGNSASYYAFALVIKLARKLMFTEKYRVKRYQYAQVKIRFLQL
jgi:hypothetical protein